MRQELPSLPSSELPLQPRGGKRAGSELLVFLSSDPPSSLLRARPCKYQTG